MAPRMTQQDKGRARKLRAEGKNGESQRSLQRTGHDDRVHPSSKPLGDPAWQVQY